MVGASVAFATANIILANSINLMVHHNRINFSKQKGYRFAAMPSLYGAELLLIFDKHSNIRMGDRPVSRRRRREVCGAGFA